MTQVKNNLYMGTTILFMILAFVEMVVCIILLCALACFILIVLVGTASSGCGFDPSGGIKKFISPLRKFERNLKWWLNTKRSFNEVIDKALGN